MSGGAAGNVEERFVTNGRILKGDLHVIEFGGPVYVMTSLTDDASAIQ